MKITKIIIILLIWGIIFSSNIFAFTSFADQITTVMVSRVSGTKDSNANVSVNISANSGMAAGTFVLNYDVSKLDIISATKGTILSAGLADVVPDTTNGMITLAYINMDGFNGTGSILDVTFKIKSTASGTIPVTLNITELSDKNYNNISSSVTQGEITVTSILLAPTAPKGLTTPSKTDTTVNLSWDAVSGATGYNAYNGTTKLTLTPITATSYVVTGLKENTEYSFTITAVNGEGESSASSVITIVTKITKGDVDGDGDIDIIDLMIIKKQLLKLNILDGVSKAVGDINNDGKISISDLLAIKKHILGMQLINQSV